MKMDENSVLSPKIHYLRNYNVSRLKGFAPFAYDHGVRKEIRLLKKERKRIFFMNYEYKVFKAKSALFLGIDLDTYGRDGWKLVSVVWDNDNACLVAVMMQEK